MALHVIDQNLLDELNAKLAEVSGSRIVFAQVYPSGHLVHDTSEVKFWGVGNLDEIFSGVRNFGSYEEIVETLPRLEDKYCRLYKYMDPRDTGERDFTEAPFPVDYKTGLTTRLHPKIEMVQGEVRSITFYEKATPDPSGIGATLYEIPVVREDYEYTRDGAGFALSRVLTISWFLEDGSVHPMKKPMPKVYDFNERIGEGKRRRGNIIDMLTKKVSEWLVITEMSNQGGDVQKTLELGRDFMLRYNTEISVFISAGKTSLYQAIESDSEHPWLDNQIGASAENTIRANLLKEIDIRKEH